MTDPTPQAGELILYRTADNAVRVEVLYESETFWLEQRRIAELFCVEIPTISYHLKEIYAPGELTREATLRKILRVQREGNRDVRREIEFYNLDAIISVGYRVNSAQATPFRIWATQISMKMVDWANRLDAFLKFNEYEVLTNAGAISAEVAKRLAEEQYEEFRVRQDRAFESDFEVEVKRIEAKQTPRRKKDTP